jgi:predicted AlkP superfamily pyrophosphatase or phosphodiesterase
MKRRKISLFIFIDAFGWEVLKKHPGFLADLVRYRKSLKTIFGYSSACDPSIISGMLPSEHLHWSSFYYSPSTSPYKWVKWLSFLPSKIANRQRVRNILSRFIKKIHGFTGYFQIYTVPFKYLPFFDYAEKKRIWDKEGLLKGTTIFDRLIEHQIPYYVGDQDSEQQQLDKVSKLLQSQSIDFAYLLLGKLDGLMHILGTRDPQVDQLIEKYDLEIRSLINIAEENYENVSWYIFSDHGMHNVQETFDLQAKIDSLGLTFGTDYAAMYDSTMARFWYLNEKARKAILDCLKEIDKGRILSDEELRQWGVFFPDHKYGETIFLMNPGVLIIPSFMGLKRIPGMHGYHPDEADSNAMICSNRPIPENVNRCDQIFSIMCREAGVI